MSIKKGVDIKSEIYKNGPGLNKIRWVTFSACLIYLVFFFNGILFHPDKYRFDPLGDGAKTIYCMQYHVADTSERSSTWHFEGMNYPIGENLNYLDAQPVITIPLRWVHANLFPVAKLIPVLDQDLMLLGFPISVLILLEIFFFYGIRNWQAGALAIMTGLNSPQIIRLGCHFSLGFLFIIPMGWLLYLRLREKPNWKRYMTILLFTMAAGFMHIYYVALFVLLYGILVLAHKAKGKQFWMQLGFLCLAPPVLFKSLLWLTGDDVTDRVHLPFGAFGEDFFGRPEDSLFPEYSSLWNGLIETGWAHRGTWEGMAFIGFGMWVICFILILVAVQRRWKSNKRFFGHRWMWLLYAVPFIWFVSMGSLYKLLPFEVRNNAPDFIRNMRSLGRLNWLVYYCMVIFFMVYLGRWVRLRQIQRKSDGIVVFCLVLCISFFEILGSAKNVLGYIGANKAVMAQYSRSAEELALKIDRSKYQAVIALPYFHFSTEEPITRMPYG